MAAVPADDAGPVFLARVTPLHPDRPAQPDEVVAKLDQEAVDVLFGVAAFGARFPPGLPGQCQQHAGQQNDGLTGCLLPVHAVTRVT